MTGSIVFIHSNHLSKHFSFAFQHCNGNLYAKYFLNAKMLKIDQCS